MKLKGSAIVVCSLAVFAIGGSTSAYAGGSQPNWIVNNNFLRPMQSVPTDAIGNFIISNIIKGRAVKVKCKAALEQTVIGGAPGKDKVKKLILSECNTEQPVECKLVEPPEAANLEWPSTLVVMGGAIEDSWTEMAFVIKFMNAGGCPLFGTLTTAPGLTVDGKWVNNGSRPTTALQGKDKIKREGEEGEGAVELSLTYEPPEGDTVEVAEENECATKKGFCVEGYEVEGAEKVPFTSKNASGNVATLTGAGLKVECKSATDEGDFSKEGKSTTTISLSECTVPEPAHCKVTEPLKFNVTDQITEFESKLVDTFYPENYPTNTTFVDLKMSNSGGTCSLAGEIPLTGILQALVDNETEAIEHTLTFSASSGSTLEVGGTAAVFKLKDVVKLGGAYIGEKWSAKK